MSRNAAVGLAVALLLSSSCNLVPTDFPVTAGQVSRILEPDVITATVITGTMTVDPNAFIAMPDPWDTSFTADDFPLWLTPLRGQARLNGRTMPQAVSGIYFSFLNDLGYLTVCSLSVRPDDVALQTISARAILPDSFSLTRPREGDSLGPGPLPVVWTRSDSAEIYTLVVEPEDSTSTARGYLLSLTDTSVVVPASAFEDSLTSLLLPGVYQVGVWSCNGGWNQGGVFRPGGGVRGAYGIFGCAVYPRPIRIRVY